MRFSVNCTSTSPKAATRPVCSQSRRGDIAGMASSTAPAASISSRTIRSAFFKRPQPQRQIRVGPGHHLVDQSGAEHQHVAGDFRPFGRFFHRGDQRAGPEHGRDQGSEVRVQENSRLRFRSIARGDHPIDRTVIVGEFDSPGKGRSGMMNAE